MAQMACFRILPLRVPQHGIGGHLPSQPMPVTFERASGASGASTESFTHGVPRGCLEGASE